eukprot:8771688-Heterocapsa_arctica.AAC.1
MPVIQLLFREKSSPPTALLYVDDDLNRNEEIRFNERLKERIGNEREARRARDAAPRERDYVATGLRVPH